MSGLGLSASEALLAFSSSVAVLLGCSVNYSHKSCHMKAL